MAAHFFCPKCWKEVEDWTIICPHCKYDIPKHAALSFEEKLIYTLSHPIDDSRMMAIQLLGDIHSRRALPYFAAILETEEDFYVIREIIRALNKIGGEESKNLIRRLKTHKSKLISSMANRICAKWELQRHF